VRASLQPAAIAALKKQQKNVALRSGGSWHRSQVILLLLQHHLNVKRPKNALAV
jgi:hypothetical protein